MTAFGSRLFVTPKDNGQDFFGLMPCYGNDHDKPSGKGLAPCYNFKMSKAPAKRVPKTYTIGLRGFAKISAVEGIQLSPEMVRDLREFDRQGLSVEERRAYIARKYGKVR